MFWNETANFVVFNGLSHECIMSWLPFSKQNVLIWYARPLPHPHHLWVNSCFTAWNRMPDDVFTFPSAPTKITFWNKDWQNLTQIFSASRKQMAIASQRSGRFSKRPINVGVTCFLYWTDLVVGWRVYLGLGPHGLRLGWRRRAPRFRKVTMAIDTGLVGSNS